MKIQILVDNIDSWYIPYSRKLINKLLSLGHKTLLIHNHNEVEKGDILCLLACEKKFNKLHLNNNNLVVHESSLPKGKGWSPMTWQILEGKNEIPITLFEANEKIDNGLIYLKKSIKFSGIELIDDIREKQGVATNKLIIDFIESYPNIIGEKQKGEESFYKKRTPLDSKLNITKEQFNLLRVCDNDRYPAFFEINGEKFIIKIFKA